MRFYGYAWNPRDFLGLQPPRSGRQSRQAESGFASISLWEIAMLIALGRLSPRGTPDAWIAELVETSGLVIKEITPAVAVLSTQFPSDFPADPADRLIAATARAEGLTLITRDTKIRQSSVVKTIW